MLRYPVKLALDASETAFMLLMDTRRDILLPARQKRGQKSVVVPALNEAKVRLY